MHRNDTDSSEKNHPARFLPVLDSRKRKIRGLWQRGEKYYAQLRMDVGNGQTKPKRVPLNSTKLADAQKELEKKRTDYRAGKLSLPGNRPLFSVFSDEYLASPIHAQKKQSTQASERVILEYWKAHVGGKRIDKITEILVKSYREKRLAQGVTARTVNKETVAFYQVLKLANDRGLITSIPRVRQMKEKDPPKRSLLAHEAVERILRACTPDVTKNADLLKLYLRFLILTGAREKEAIRIRWADVDFEKRFVTIGADGDSKNARHRTVNFTPELQSLLQEMSAVRPPDTSFLFPSPQRGPKDAAAHSLRESFKLARSKAGFVHVGFHDFRHFFASQCVMAGIDFMTVAHWLGHSDGGVLVGKVYGHLADEHKSRMADNLSILGPPANVVEISAA